MLGIVLPGTGSASPYFQSRMSPSGWASSWGVSWRNGWTTMSLTGLGRCFLASSEIFLARSLKISHSCLASQYGSVAGLNGCMKVWRSPQVRSCFSYQCATGSTTSA